MQWRRGEVLSTRTPTWFFLFPNGFGFFFSLSLNILIEKKNNTVFSLDLFPEKLIIRKDCIDDLCWSCRTSRNIIIMRKTYYAACLHSFRIPNPKHISVVFIMARACAYKLETWRNNYAFNSIYIVLIISNYIYAANQKWQIHADMCLCGFSNFLNALW